MTTQGLHEDVEDAPEIEERLTAVEEFRRFLELLESFGEPETPELYPHTPPFEPGSGSSPYAMGDPIVGYYG